MVRRAVLIMATKNNKLNRFRSLDAGIAQPRHLEHGVCIPKKLLTSSYNREPSCYRLSYYFEKERTYFRTSLVFLTHL